MTKPEAYKTLKALYAAYERPDGEYSDVQEAKNNAKLNNFDYAEYHDCENHALIVKEFNKDSYNGPTQRDFKRRLEIIFETAKTKLEKQLNENQFNHTEYQLKLKKIENSRLIAFNEISRHCIVEPKQISELLAFEKQLIPKIRQAKKHIQQFVFDALAVIDPSAFENEETLKTGLLAFAADESSLMVKKGRPNFVNLYPTPFDDAPFDDAVTRVSMQRVIGDAIPSTERSGKPEGKLPNFVECGIGYRDANGKFVSEFSGYRHSSYPTIKVKDDFQRQKNTALTVKDMLRELARKQMLAPSNEDPIVLKLSSLTLLSPIKRDWILMAEGESEQRQLRESYNALMMYNDREIELNVDGKAIKVKLDVNLVNTAANWHGILVTTPGIQSNLEKSINTEGMNRYIKETEQYLKNKNKWTIFIDIEQDFKITNITNMLNELRKILIEKNTELESFLIDNKESDYTAKQREVSVLKKQIYAFELKLMDERKKVYSKSRQEIEKHLNEIKKGGNKDNPTQVAELYYQSIAMYMDGKVEPSQFGVRYLLANEKMGRSVEFFCKSGEDRTGRMQNLLEELCEFNRAKGYFPGYDFKAKSMNEEDVKAHRTIAKYVSEFSVSRDINDENVHGARGLQITSSLHLNKELPNQSGDMLGKTAKAVFIFDKSLQNRTIQNAKGNVFVEENNKQGFVSRIVRAQDREQYKINESPSISACEISNGIPKAPMYRSQKIDKGDLVVIEKTYEIKNDAGEVTQSVVGRLEKDLNSIRDVTKVSKGVLPIECSIEMAFKQAYGALKPPFKALTINGSDDAQVARVHAALLVLKYAHPYLKNLMIYVEGNSAVPSKGKSKSKQKAADKLFIEEQLSSMRSLPDPTKAFAALIEKQHGMKAFVAMKRNEQEGLNVIEGAYVRPPFDKK